MGRWRRRGLGLGRIRLLGRFSTWSTRGNLRLIEVIFRKLWAGGIRLSLRNFIRGRLGKILGFRCWRISRLCRLIVWLILKMDCSCRKVEGQRILEKGGSNLLLRGVWYLLLLWLDPVELSVSLGKAMKASTRRLRGWRWSKEMRGILIQANPRQEYRRQWHQGWWIYSSVVVHSPRR